MLAISVDEKHRIADNGSDDSSLFEPLLADPS